MKHFFFFNNFSPHFFHFLILSFYFHLFGANSPQIFHTLKAPIDKYYATILLGGAELLGALCTVFLVHLTGKRPLMFVSLIGVGSCFFATATYAYFLDIVPGSGVDNVVANRSMKDLDRLSFINELNLTEAFENLDDAEGSEYEITTEFLTNLNESTTFWVERMHSTNMPVTNYTAIDDDTANVILSIPNAKENQFLWIPLALLIAGAVLSHLGMSHTVCVRLD